MNMDINEHKKTWTGFMKFTKLMSIFVIGLVLFLGFMTL